jgi:hypothetical protein
MTRIITLTALTALGLPGEPFHEPFHEPTTADATQRHHAPGTFPAGAADNGSAPSSVRAQHRSAFRVMVGPGGVGQDYRT